MKNEILDNLIKTFSKLPTLGQRSAKRMVLHLLNNKENLMKPLIDSLGQSYSQIKKCKNCGNIVPNFVKKCPFCNKTIAQ